MVAKHTVLPGYQTYPELSVQNNVVMHLFLNYFDICLHKYSMLYHNGSFFFYSYFGWWHKPCASNNGENIQAITDASK